uniref:Uncharacterized protein n=1 Tax=Arundo donax TaxID=35708 RepID=A0A0A9HGU9_ARUDO
MIYHKRTRHSLSNCFGNLMLYHLCCLWIKQMQVWTARSSSAALDPTEKGL